MKNKRRLDHKIGHVSKINIYFFLAKSCMFISIEFFKFHVKKKILKVPIVLCGVRRFKLYLCLTSLLCLAVCRVRRPHLS